MKKMIMIHLSCFIAMIYSAFAFSNESSMKNTVAMPHSTYYEVSIINDSNDDYTINYIYQPNKQGQGWTPINLPSKSDQSLIYWNPPYYGFYLNIVRNKDGYVFFYGSKSQGSIVIPEETTV